MTQVSMLQNKRYVMLHCNSEYVPKTDLHEMPRWSTNILKKGY